jgi:hypothetical protein
VDRSAPGAAPFVFKGAVFKYPKCHPTTPTMSAPWRASASPYRDTNSRRLRIDRHSKIDINSGLGKLRSPTLELPMILIAPRENTALRPGRSQLVPTGRSFLSSLALPARRGPAYANACEMILLHDSVVKRPGIILLHKMTVRRRSASRTNDVSPGTLLESAHWMRIALDRGAPASPLQ